MKDHSQENSMILGAEYEESYDQHEPCFERIPPVQGTLESRVSAMILHISSHGSFDKGDLIELLKDCNKTIRKADDNFRSIVDTCTMIDNEIERLKGTVKVQA